MVLLFDIHGDIYGKLHIPVIGRDIWTDCLIGCKYCGTTLLINSGCRRFVWWWVKTWELIVSDNKESQPS